MTGAGLRLAGIAGLGAIAYALSELAFYPLDLALDLWVGVLAYGLCGWAMVCALAVTGRWDRDGWWLGAGLLGFLVEGLVVAELYIALPVSIVWTPLAWHAAVSVWIGVLGLSAALARGPGPAALAAGAFGAGLGLWGAWMWTAEDGPGPVSHALQIALAWSMLVAGHALWGRVAPHLTQMDLRPDAWLLALGGALLWAIAWAVPLFPLSLLLPGLVLITILALRGSVAPARPVSPPPRIPALAATVTLPLAAIAFHALARPWPDWEANVVALLLLGGPAAWFWGRAMLRGLRHAGHD